MKQIIISLTGEESSQLQNLDHIVDQIKQGFTSGQNKNGDDSYEFSVHDIDG